MPHPPKTFTILSTIPGNQMGKEGQIQAPEVDPVACYMVIARDGEGGVSYVQRMVVPMGGPVGMAAGESQSIASLLLGPNVYIHLSISHTGTVLPASGQPQFTPQVPVHVRQPYALLPGEEDEAMPSRNHQ